MGGSSVFARFECDSVTSPMRIIAARLPSVAVCMDSQLLLPTDTQAHLFDSGHTRAPGQPSIAVRYSDQICELKEGCCILIGRAAQCDLRITDDLSVSRIHCHIVVIDGEARLLDCGSTNGTWVNCERVQGSAMRIHPGQLIQIGESMLTVTGSSDQLLPNKPH